MNKSDHDPIEQGGVACEALAVPGHRSPALIGRVRSLLQLVIVQILQLHKRPARDDQAAPDSPAARGTARPVPAPDDWLATAPAGRHAHPRFVVQSFDLVLPLFFLDFFLIVQNFCNVNFPNSGVEDAAPLPSPRPPSSSAAPQHGGDVRQRRPVCDTLPSPATRGTAPRPPLQTPCTAGASKAVVPWLDQPPKALKKLPRPVPGCAAPAGPESRPGPGAAGNTQTRPSAAEPGSSGAWLGVGAWLMVCNTGCEGMEAAARSGLIGL